MLKDWRVSATPGAWATASARVSASTPSTSSLIRSARFAASTPSAGSTATSEAGTSGASGLTACRPASKVAKEVKTVGSTLNRRSDARPTISIGTSPSGPRRTTSPMSSPRATSRSEATPSPSASGRRPSTNVVGAPGPPSS